MKTDEESRKALQRVQEKCQTMLYTGREEDTDAPSRRRAREKAMLYYIQSGNVPKIRQMLEEPNPMPLGKLSANPMQQTLFMTVSGITLFCRAALDGGLPENIAYALSDAYIQEASKASSIEVVHVLTASAMLDYTKRVFAWQHRSCSRTVLDCCDYIQRHMHDRISLEDLAGSVSRSPHYICDLFRSELHTSPHRYIRLQKLEYARNILLISSLSVEQIAELTAFPSSSAFIADFQKQYGQTPHRYRRNNTGTALYSMQKEN